ncbi:MAG TPA: hypothetical protein VJR58_05190 [Vineibacter sp.]|nr:hypothetical protein [Vineibacter sp.]
MMHSSHFRTQTGIKLSISLGSTRSSDELISIHRDLNAFERGDYPKFKPEARWDFMLKLAGKCELYMKDKQAKGRDLSKPKHLCIQQLSADLTREVAAERNKAQKYGGRVAAARGHAFAYDTPMTHAMTVKGITYDGGTVLREAQCAGVRISGNDNVDAFALREWLKQMARQDKLGHLCYTAYEMLNREQRKKARLSFRDGKCLQGGTPFWTRFNYVPFVISKSGEWYALQLASDSSQASYLHKLLSVGEVLFAGEMMVSPNGTLQVIHNTSASYDPKIKDFLTVVDQLRRSGLDQAARHKICFLVADREYKYAPYSFGRYLFPYSVFAQSNGNVPDPTAYGVDGNDKWDKPSARRHGCHHLTTLPDGRVEFPD